MHTDVLTHEGLRRGFDGQVLAPGDDGYDTARTVWNAMVDRRPTVIVRPANAGDVGRAVGFARTRGLEIGIRCGGHSVVGHAVPDGGLMIDLSLMQAVRVDPDRRRAWVQGGALLGDLDRATQAHRLATTAGNVSHTGVGGLTLGGGMGWLARQFALACDNVEAFEVVTADGSIVRATATENPDLFWGLRGGGGNFGVVTEFEFRLHPLAGHALVADFSFELDDAPAVLRRWADLIPETPRQATPTAWAGRGENGRPITSAGYIWVGDLDQGRGMLPAFRGLGPVVTESVRDVSYLGLQSGDDMSARHGMRRYWKGHYLRELSDAAIDAFLSVASMDAGNLHGSFQTHGGAIAEVDGDETAFSHRDTFVEFDSGTSWIDPADDDRQLAAARRYGAAVEPFASGVYVNALADEGASGVARAYGVDGLQRLTAIKDRFDPDNVFHLNQNIRPSGSPPA